MNLAILIPALVCAAMMAGLALVLHNLARAESALPVTAEWINELSMDRYRPMMRILDSSDFEFLRAQPGYTSQMESRLRTQRCQVLRGYLQCLDMDFKRVATALKVVMTQSDQDRSDLAMALVQHQVRFAMGMVWVRCQLYPYEFGIGRIDVTSLLQVFDVMRVELGNMVPSASEVCA